jgi:hypothetical protein
MPSKPIQPITLDVLRTLVQHGPQTLEQLRQHLPDLHSKTMGNITQASWALRNATGAFIITTKGRARLLQGTGPATATTEAPPRMSSTELQAFVIKSLEKTASAGQVAPTITELAVATGYSTALLRPAVTTLVQAERLVGSRRKPTRYSLPGSATAPQRTAPRQPLFGSSVGLGCGGPRDRLSRDDYTCPELDRNAGITPDRFAAFALPSRVGNRLYYRDGRVETVA